MVVAMTSASVCGTSVSASDIFCRAFGDFPRERTTTMESARPQRAGRVAGWASAFPGQVISPGAATGEADPLSWLATLAAAGDRTALAEHAEQMPWHLLGPRSTARGVRLALAAGATLTAREIATAAQRLYPEDTELTGMARLLSPPRDLGVAPAEPTLSLDWQWVRRHAADYRGQWIALSAGELVAHAATARGLIELLPDRRGLFITHLV